MRQAVKSMCTLRQIHVRIPSQRKGWSDNSNQPSLAVRIRHLSVVEVFYVFQADVPRDVDD